MSPCSSTLTTVGFTADLLWGTKEVEKQPNNAGTKNLAASKAVDFCTGEKHWKSEYKTTEIRHRLKWNGDLNQQHQHISTHSLAYKQVIAQQYYLPIKYLAKHILHWDNLMWIYTKGRIWKWSTTPHNEHSKRI